MNGDFDKFFADQPFWAVIILLLMALPIVGAVAWVILRALRRRDGAGD